MRLAAMLLLLLLMMVMITCEGKSVMKICRHHCYLYLLQMINKKSHKPFQMNYQFWIILKVSTHSAMPIVQYCG